MKQKVEKKMKDLEKIQNKILELFENTNEKTATEMIIGWLGWEYLSEVFRDSINNYDNVEVLEHFLNNLKNKI